MEHVCRTYLQQSTFSTFCDSGAIALPSEYGWSDDQREGSVDMSRWAFLLRSISQQVMRATGRSLANTNPAAEIEIVSGRSEEGRECETQADRGLRLSVLLGFESVSVAICVSFSFAGFLCSFPLPLNASQEAQDRLDSFKRYVQG